MRILAALGIALVMSACSAPKILTDQVGEGESLKNNKKVTLVISLENRDPKKLLTSDETKSVVSQTRAIFAEVFGRKGVAISELPEAGMPEVRIDYKWGKPGMIYLSGFSRPYDVDVTASLRKNGKVLLETTSWDMNDPTLYRMVEQIIRKHAELFPSKF